MRICVVSDQAFPAWGGEGIATQNLCLRLARRGHRVLFLSSRVPRAPQPAGIEVKRFPAVYVPGKGHFAFADVGGIVSILQEYGADIVHVNLPTLLGWQSLRAGRLLQIPLVAGFHVQTRNVVPYDGFPFSSARCVLGKWFSFFYRKAALAISPSHLGRKILQRYGVSRVEVVSNGIDLSRFRSQLLPEEEVARLRERFQLGNGPIILYVGRLSREKNLPFLLDIMSCCARSLGPGGEAKLLVVGSGELESSLVKEIKRRLLLEKVRLAGFLSGTQLLAAYKAAHIFILPSLCELQSIVTLEALSMGCPVLIGASPENAARELVKEGMNGYTFSLQDPMDATVKIETILGASDAARRQMSQVSVALSWAHDSSKCVDRVEQIYAELAGIPSG